MAVAAFFSATFSHNPFLIRFSRPLLPSGSDTSSRLHSLGISSSFLTPEAPNPAAITSTTSALTNSSPATFIPRFGPNEPCKGVDVLVEALERQVMRHVFTYPGGASIEIHLALTHSKTIRNVQPRHEQGGIFAAEGYARSSSCLGVCIATSRPRATDLVSGLVDNSLDRVPIVAITGQVLFLYVYIHMFACHVTA
ncbi:hypothetical protein CDL15_Pgr009011 [Punica granatum]|uniref:Thiamine pyrophosphate enzyme N-terminal TPP-binding domain-containing protein n=1 Tax=Punica granatum TaxID=22663 RepID=A0A218VZG4_PUNGR|nr:hypothetical protein CDL15_Pgr009011 [Punica granatum]